MMTNNEWHFLLQIDSYFFQEYDTKIYHLYILCTGYIEVYDCRNYRKDKSNDEKIKIIFQKCNK